MESVKDIPENLVKTAEGSELSIIQKVLTFVKNVYGVSNCIGMLTMKKSLEKKNIGRI